MSKPSIKTITVKNLVTFLLVLSLILLLITGLNLRALSKTALESQALAHAELVKAGLTAHMKAGIMNKRDYFLQEIKQLHQVTQLNIIRGEAVQNQFGRGVIWEKQQIDDVSRLAFDSAAPVYLLNEFSLTPTIRIVIPYIASQQGALNCLSCHQVEEGTVLGAVDIELNVTEYRNHSLLVLLIIFIISILFLVLMRLNTRHTIERHVQAPLETLIDEAMLAYKKQKPLDEDIFSTKEFSAVANEINLFNSEIIANQDLLRSKNEELIALNNEIESTLRETVYTMGVIEEQRSKETNNHTRRVTLYSRFLAQQVGLSAQDVDLITTASPLHDIGKLGIPDEILFKPGQLTPEERQVMEHHTRIGYTMLCHSQRSILKAGAIVALQHHEKWDGSGYPQKLKGEAIHIYGRIVAVADVFDALYSERIYKESWSIEKIVAFFKQERGRHFDPEMTDIFLNNTAAFVAIYQQHPSTSPPES